MVAVPALTAVTVPSLPTVAISVLDDDHTTVASSALPGVTFAVSFPVAPRVSVSAVLSSVTVSTRIGFTVTMHVAVLPPSCMVAVIVVSPALCVVTVPSLSTVATSGLDDDHTTVLPSALLGVTFAVSFPVSPRVNMSVSLSSVIFSTGLCIVLTVTVHSAVLPPACAVMLAVPALTAVTVPSLPTVATDVSDDDHFTVLSSALSGATVAVSILVLPGSIVSVVALRVTLSTATGESGFTTAVSFTVITHIAVLSPA